MFFKKSSFIEFNVCYYILNLWVYVRYGFVLLGKIHFPTYVPFFLYISFVYIICFMFINKSYNLLIVYIYMYIFVFFKNLINLICCLI